MNSSRTVRRVVLLSAFVIAMFALPTIASAADKNHDKLPDRWEKRYKLSLKVKQTTKDQDRDGLKNLAEFKAGDNPRRADSDADGTDDGDENAGTVASFSGGVLTIDLFNGGTVSGEVTDATRIRCDNDEDDDATEQTSSARDSGPGSGGSDDEGSDDSSGNSGSEGPSGNSGPGHHGDEGECNCSTDELTVGTVVEEAELELGDGTATFEKIELGDAA